MPPAVRRAKRRQPHERIPEIRPAAEIHKEPVESGRVRPSPRLSERLRLRHHGLACRRYRPAGCQRPRQFDLPQQSGVALGFDDRRPGRRIGVERGGQCGVVNDYDARRQFCDVRVRQRSAQLPRIEMMAGYESSRYAEGQVVHRAREGPRSRPRPVVDEGVAVLVRKADRHSAGDPVGEIACGEPARRVQRGDEGVRRAVELERRGGYRSRYSDLRQAEHRQGACAVRGHEAAVAEQHRLIALDLSRRQLDAIQRTAQHLAGLDVQRRQPRPRMAPQATALIARDRQRPPGNVLGQRCQPAEYCADGDRTDQRSRSEALQLMGHAGVPAIEAASQGLDDVVTDRHGRKHVAPGAPIQLGCQNHARDDDGPGVRNRAQARVGVTLAECESTQQEGSVIGPVEPAFNRPGADMPVSRVRAAPSEHQVASRDRHSR